MGHLYNRHMPDDNAIHAVLLPQGLWTDSCEVWCPECEMRYVVPTCEAAQTVADFHDATRHDQDNDEIC